jgi:hypothetical protein
LIVSSTTGVTRSMKVMKPILPYVTALRGTLTFPLAIGDHHLNGDQR